MTSLVLRLVVPTVVAFAGGATLARGSALAARAAGPAVTPESLSASAKGFAKKNDYPRAIPYLQGAVALSGQKPDYLLELADAFKLAGQYDEAVAEYERFLKRAPKEHPKAAYAEAEAERLVEAPRPFDAQVFRLVAADREARALFAAGQKHVKSKETEEALACFEAAAALSPDLPGPYRLIGALYGKLGQKDKERDFLLRYLRIKPEGALVPEIRERLGAAGLLGKVTVTASFPSDAFINGRPIGRTPIKELPLPDGRYTLTIRNADLKFIKNTSLKVEAGKPITKDVAYAVIKMKLEPWARVKVGGKDLGLWDEFAMPAGEHALELRAGDGSKQKTVQLVIKGGETIVLSQW